MIKGVMEFSNKGEPPGTRIVTRIRLTVFRQRLPSRNTYAINCVYLVKIWRAYLSAVLANLTSN